MIPKAIVQEEVLPVPEGYLEIPASEFHELDNI